MWLSKLKPLLHVRLAEQNNLRKLGVDDVEGGKITTFT